MEPADLSLSERDSLDLGARLLSVVGELEQRVHGVGAGRQDEDERRAAVRVGERTGQVERRRLDELSAQVLRRHGRSWDFSSGGVEN